MKKESNKYLVTDQEVVSAFVSEVYMQRKVLHPRKLTVIIDIVREKMHKTFDKTGVFHSKWFNNEGEVFTYLSNLFLSTNQFLELSLSDKQYDERMGIEKPDFNPSKNPEMYSDYVSKIDTDVLLKSMHKNIIEAIQREVTCQACKHNKKRWYCRNCIVKSRLKKEQVRGKRKEFKYEV